MTHLHTTRRRVLASLCAAALLLGASSVNAKDMVKIAFIGPLTGGVAANGLGGRNSVELAVRLRNEDAKAKYRYELVSLDDECKPNVGVQVATKAAADNAIIAGVAHYCSAVAMSAVDVYHRFGLPVVVWGAVLPDVTYGNEYKEIHRVNGTMINQNEVASQFMLAQGYKRWVIVHDTTDYGKGHNKVSAPRHGTTPLSARRSSRAACTAAAPSIRKVVPLLSPPRPLQEPNNCATARAARRSSARAKELAARERSPWRAHPTQPNCSAAQALW